MAITVRVNLTIDGAFQVFGVSLNVTKQRPTAQVVTDAGVVGTKVGTAYTINGTMTFALDSLRGTGVDLEAWAASETGKLVEYDRGPKHHVLNHCFIASETDNGNPGQAQRDISVSFTAETDDPI